MGIHIFELMKTIEEAKLRHWSIDVDVEKDKRRITKGDCV
jgi:hypothetical protein